METERRTRGSRGCLSKALCPPPPLRLRTLGNALLHTVMLKRLEGFQSSERDYAAFSEIQVRHIYPEPGLLKSCMDISVATQPWERDQHCHPPGWTPHTRYSSSVGEPRSPDLQSPGTEVTGGHRMTTAWMRTREVRAASVWSCDRAPWRAQGCRSSGRKATPAPRRERAQAEVWRQRNENGAPS